MKLLIKVTFYTFIIASINCVQQHRREPWLIHTVGNFPLFFEEIGSVVFYHNDWTVITKIPRTNFEPSIRLANACIEELEKFCKLVNDHSDVDSTIQLNCNNTADSISQFLNTITRQTGDLDHIFWKVRQKRELTSVGRFLKWAFGTMDKNDAKYIYRKLGILSNTTGSSLTIHDRQITLLKASYQDLSQPILHLETNINTVKQQINYQTEYLNSTVVQQHMDVYWLKYEMRAQSLINRLLILMSTIGHYVNTELFIMNELYHNRLPLGMLSKEILSELYRNISKIVQTHSDFNTFYALHLLTNVAISTTNEDIFVYLKIPLPARDEYVLRQMYRLPQRISGEHRLSYILDIDSDYVAEGDRKSMLLSNDQLQQCHIVDLHRQKMHVCRAHGTWLSPHAENCIILLLNNPKTIPKLCHFKIMSQPLELFLPMHQPNLWLFSFVIPKEFYIECDSKQSTVRLNSTGMIQLRQDCSVRTDSIALPVYRNGHSNVSVSSLNQGLLTVSGNPSPKGQLNLSKMKENQFLAERLVVTDFNQLKKIITDRMMDMDALHRETRQYQALYDAQSENLKIKNWQIISLGTSIASLSLSSILFVILVGVVLYYKKFNRRIVQPPMATTNNATSVVIPKDVSEVGLKKHCADQSLYFLKTIEIHADCV